MSTLPTFCAIDFGTSNSAVAVPRADGMQLVELEPGQRTMPTAVFYFAEGPHDADGPPRAFGRAAVAAYVDGHEGRLMRSMKSILGSPLIEQTTDVGGGRGARYADIVAGYLKRLRRLAGEPARVVLGRPVFFVDGEPARDASAQDQLEACARAVGFADVHFQYEPIAAAFDFEQQAIREGRGEQVVLVADIGGGTSDFSLVRVGPERVQRLARRDDILASHGVHIAGTDFDRHIELAGLLQAFGYRAVGPTGREVPSGIYFDLATWHLINTCYAPLRVAEWRNMKSWFTDVRHHARLMTVLEERLGHELAARAEGAKIAISGGADTTVDLSHVERGLVLPLSEKTAVDALRADLDRIIATAHETVAMAGLKADQVDALYFTGGSTGLRLLVDGMAAGFPQAARVTGDRFASVATGLGLHAQRLFAGR